MNKAPKDQQMIKAREDRRIIREMTEADLDRVTEIERANFSVPWKKKDFYDFMIRDDTIFLTAAEGDEIAGYIGFYGYPDEGDITNVSVDAAYRQRGIGRALLDELSRRASDRGITKIFLEVRESNADAIRLYHSAGYEQVGLRKDYYSSPKENALIMRRDAAAVEKDIKN